MGVAHLLNSTFSKTPADSIIFISLAIASLIVKGTVQRQEDLDSVFFFAVSVTFMDFTVPSSSWNTSSYLCKSSSNLKVLCD